MKEIIYQFSPAPQLSVNGHVFELQMSDADIFDRALKISDKYAKLNKDSSVKQIANAVRECAAIVDEVLGKGAMKQIAQGKPVSLRDSIRVMSAIMVEASSAYAKKLSEYD